MTESERSAMGAPLQAFVMVTEIAGANLSIATISPARAALSEQIYKICTLLSTGIVENMTHATPAIGRKPLPGADFGVIHRFPQ